MLIKWRHFCFDSCRTSSEWRATFQGWSRRVWRLKWNADGMPWNECLLMSRKPLGVPSHNWSSTWDLPVRRGNVFFIYLLLNSIPLMCLRMNEGECCVGKWLDVFIHKMIFPYYLWEDEAKRDTTLNWFLIIREGQWYPSDRSHRVEASIILVWKKGSFWERRAPWQSGVKERWWAKMIAHHPARLAIQSLLLHSFILYIS